MRKLPNRQYRRIQLLAYAPLHIVRLALVLTQHLSTCLFLLVAFEVDSKVAQEGVVRAGVARGGDGPGSIDESGLLWL